MMSTIFYPRFFDRLKKYNLNLENVSTKDKSSKKYSYMSCDKNNDSIEFYKNNKLLAKGENLELSFLLLIYLFIDKYGDKKIPLPVFEDNYYFFNYENAKIVMEFLLEPVKTYDDCIALIKKTGRNLVPLYEEFVEGYKEQVHNNDNGVELGNFLFTKRENGKYVNIYGNKMGEFGTNGRYLKKTNNNEWEVYFMKDRSNDLEYMFTICDEECLYRYMLNYTLCAII